MKKILSLLLCLVLLSATMLTLASCNKGDDKDEKTVMNLSLNPEVEFVLDEDNKVISVNALNEEGNLIVSAEVFVGKSAEEAAKLFAEIAEELGFLVAGNVEAGVNDIKIALSGSESEAKKLYDDVKGEIEDYLSEENITATITEAEAITEAELKALLAECAPYIDTAEMEYAALVDALAESRKETAELYSQELKNAYYEAKAFAMEQAEIEVLMGQLSTMEKIIVGGLNDVYVGLVETIETTRLELLVNEDSVYQKALADFREAKAEYLAYRREVAAMEDSEVTDAVTAQLDALESLVESTEAALISAGQSANDALDLAKAEIKVAYDAVMKQITDASIVVADYAEQISAKQTEAKTAFFDRFESDYAAAKTAAETNWSEMKNSIVSSENP